MSIYYSPPNNQVDYPSDFDAQINFIIDLDNLDTWQHESTLAYFFDEPMGVRGGFFWKGVLFF